jgi:hypothetical protein
MPRHQPLWASLYAVNVNTGKIAWRVNLASPTACRKASVTPGRPNLRAVTIASGLIFTAPPMTAASRLRDPHRQGDLDLLSWMLPPMPRPSPIAARTASMSPSWRPGGLFVHSPAVGDSLVVFARRVRQK